MTDDEYTEATDQLFMVGRLAEHIDAAGVLERIRPMDTLGPILDPTAWRHGHERVRAIGELASELQRFQNAFMRLKSVVEATEPGAEMYRRIRGL